MTITLTVEEIKEYEKKLERWYAERTAMIFSSMSSRSDFGFSPTPTISSDAIMRWEKDHPAPRLLPDV